MVRTVNPCAPYNLVSSLGGSLIIINLIQYLAGAEIYSFPDDIYGTLPPALIF